MAVLLYYYWNLVFLFKLLLMELKTHNNSQQLTCQDASCDPQHLEADHQF